MPEPKGRKRFLSTDELKRLFEAAEPYTLMRAAILVSIATGMRQGELLGLTWADIDIDGATATLLETKNGSTRRVHLTSQAILALKSLWNDRQTPPPPATLVFNIAGQRLQRYQLEARWRPIKKAANLEDFRWHDLRHSCASFLAQHGSSLLEIGELLGHKSPVSTKRYAHFKQGAPAAGHSALDDMLKGK